MAVAISGPIPGTVISRLAIPFSLAVRGRARDPAATARGTGLLPDRLSHDATPQMSLKAAAQVARQAGVTPVLLGDAPEGEAAQLGTVMAGIARAAATKGTPVKAPAVLLSGGEGTVTIGAMPPGVAGGTPGSCWP